MSGTEAVPVEVADPRRLARRAGGHEQGCLGHPVGRALGERGESVRSESVLELMQRGRPHGLAPVDQCGDPAEVDVAALGRPAATGGVLVGEVRCCRDHAGRLGQQLDPAQRSLHERPRGHHRARATDHRRDDHHQQTHVVEQRKPAHRPARLRGYLVGGHHLQHVGQHAAVGDLHTGGHPGRTRGVLQVRHVVATHRRARPRLGERVRHPVHRDDARTLRRRDVFEEAPHTGSGGAGSEHHGGRAVAQHSVQAVGVAGLLRIEQRHSHQPGVHGGEEPDDVFHALGGENRHSGARSRNLLQAGRDSADAHPQLAVRQGGADTVIVGCVVHRGGGRSVAARARHRLEVVDNRTVSEPNNETLRRNLLYGDLPIHRTSSITLLAIVDA